MEVPQSPARKGRGPWVVIAILAALFAIYQGVMFAVRRHVDGEIARSAGQRLFDFELEDIAGKSWRTADLAGKKVVLNFFRSHCQMCRVEAPALRDFVRRVTPDGVVVLGIMMDEVQGYPPETTQRTLIELSYEHPVCMADAKFLDAFHGAGWSHVTPVTYVADANGEIVAAMRGHQRLEALLEAVR